MPAPFTTEHAMLRQVARNFVETEINPNTEAWERAGIFPAHALLKKMGALGLLGLSYPEAYGGGGADYWFNTVLLEELGRAEPMG